MTNAIPNARAIRKRGRCFIDEVFSSRGMRRRFLLIVTVVSILLTGGSANAEDHRNRNDDKPEFANQGRRDFSGAFFVTTVTGSVAGGNRFPSKCAVYLDGGPGPHAPKRAPGLPDGDYYFQVTDQSGQALLSTDPVSNRKFHVSGGVITAFTGTGGAAHPTGVDQDNAGRKAITIQLANSSCPTDYLKTPNAGNLYRVWVTPVASFVGKPANVDNACGRGCFHGFDTSKSRSDNFKAESGVSASFCLNMQSQFYDGHTTFPNLLGWGMTVTDALGITNHYTTDSSTGQVMACQLSAGTYSVTPDSFDAIAQTPPIPAWCGSASPYQSALDGIVQPNSGTVTFSGSTQQVNVAFITQLACVE